MLNNILIVYNIFKKIINTTTTRKKKLTITLKFNLIRE